MDELRFYAYCLQGDVTAAYHYLQSLSEKTKKQQELETKYKKRFFTENQMYHFTTEDPWIRKVMSAYFDYFKAVLTRKNIAEAESQLSFSLTKLIRDGESTQNLDEIEAELEKSFVTKGYSFLGGVTTPFRGPYIWKTTKKREFIVELPHHRQKVTVYFLSDFLMHGWLHHATFGEKYAGGWAKENGLYYVDEGGKIESIESSEFQVSYLKHEAQHLHDYSRFPMLMVKDLEYRAKLVELIYETNSYRLLNKFFYEQKNDPLHPHPYSSFVIMERLTDFAFPKMEDAVLEQWRALDPNQIQKWASTLFEEHTEKLQNNPIGII